MKLNRDYTQQSVPETYTFDNYNLLKGKVVDKVAFTNRGEYDEQFFIITFTDHTYISIGLAYDESDDELKLANNWIIDPSCYSGGNFDCHSYIDSKGKLHFDKWIDILRDLNIWYINEEEALQIIQADKKKQEEREYQQYLRLKEKFENKENNE